MVRALRQKNCGSVSRNRAADLALGQQKDCLSQPQSRGSDAGIYRVLERERGAAGHSASDPIRLVRHSDRRLSLRDPLTATRAEHSGFGAGNTRALARQIEE